MLPLDDYWKTADLSSPSSNLINCKTYLVSHTSYLLTAPSNLYLSFQIRFKPGLNQRHYLSQMTNIAETVFFHGNASSNQIFRFYAQLVVTVEGIIGEKKREKK